MHDYDGSTIGSPLILFNKRLDTMIVSPLNHPMIAVQQSEKGVLSCGPSGKIDVIPAHFTHETLLVVGSGVNSTMSAFGDAMLRNGNKHRPSLFATGSKLSYSTGFVGFSSSLCWFFFFFLSSETAHIFITTRCPTRRTSKPCCFSKPLLSKIPRFQWELSNSIRGGTIAT